MNIHKNSKLLPAESPSGHGYVYLIAIEPEGPVKVGITTNARKRIQSLETSTGQRFRCIGVSRPCSNYAEIERTVHELMRTRRTIGEWFDVPFQTGLVIMGQQKYVAYKPDWNALVAAANRLKPVSQEQYQALVDSGAIAG